jgi:hypothetical protein
MGGKTETIIVKVSKDMKKDIARFTKKYEVTIAHFIRRAILRELNTGQ